MSAVSISSIAVATRGRGLGNQNASLERQGDAGWGVQTRQPTHVLVQEHGAWVERPIRREVP